ncbi:MAG TPA: methyltransferase domain-containing protein [Xanthobacteraceae bacterium]|nr:methyltransferase domain-containing protein [Xanthobacteraceae bacterium]
MRASRDIRRPDGRATPWQRVKGKGAYPVEYAAWLLNPLRYLILSPGRVVGRLRLSPTDRVLEVGCGPGFFSPAVARRLSAGHLTLLDAQAGMLAMAARRLKQHGLANFTAVTGLAELLPFADAAFDAVFMITVLGEVPDRAAALAEAARVLRPGGRFSATEAAGDPDRVRRAELDERAAGAGLAKAESFPGLLAATFNYRKETESG